MAPAKAKPKTKTKAKKKDKTAAKPRAEDEHLRKIHEAQERVAKVEKARERLRAVARSSMGFGVGNGSPVREGIHRTKAGLYPLAALGLLVIVDQFQAFGFFVLGPEISRALGIRPSTLAGMNALKGLAIAAAALPMAALVQKVARRGLLSIVTGFGWALTTLFTGCRRPRSGG